jgi:hypothetical protein
VLFDRLGRLEFQDRFRNAPCLIGGHCIHALGPTPAQLPRDEVVLLRTTERPEHEKHRHRDGAHRGSEHGRKLPLFVALPAPLGAL